jgi:epoxyqueuosine reductase
MESLSDRIRSKAIELGFCKVGIARAVALEEEGRLLREWLSQGYHGTMEWMARNVEQRVDPKKVLRNAKSVVVVAMNYYTEAHHSEDPDTGKISRYAWGDDYHEIMVPRLEKLLQSVKQEVPGVRGKVYVDTGPVMDKVWAARAGIGWEGKHTNVIAREVGSWIFLGEIILDIGLEYNEPAADYCGTCTRCIDACPTHAIVEAYVLNSNLCISYLTIEHRGDIPDALSSQSENWIYGCDICQDVCPWNQKFSEPTSEVAFEPRDCNLSPKLNELAEMSEEKFRRQFRRSPIKRTKYSGLMRNVSAVVKNRELVQERS